MTVRKNCTFVSMTQAELDAGAGDALASDRIVIVDVAGAATGVIYDSGAAGVSPIPLVGGGASTANSSAVTQVSASNARVTFTQALLDAGGPVVHLNDGVTGLDLVAADWPDDRFFHLTNVSTSTSIPVTIGAGWTRARTPTLSITTGDLLSLQPGEYALIQMSNGYLNVAEISGSGSRMHQTWAANTWYEKGELVYANAIQGSVRIGDAIIRNASGKSAATFDATEAAKWVEVAEDPDLMTTDTAQSVNAVKTFSTLPEMSADASTANHPVRKSQYDSGMDTKETKVTGKGLSTNDYTTTEKNKLAGVASGATANDTDANLKARANHTGTQAQSTVDNLPTDLGLKEVLANKSISIATDGTSDTKYPSAKAVKTYADGLVVGLLDYRGAFTPAVSSGATGYPTASGSGTAGAILKGDAYSASAAGFILTEAIQSGDMVIAKIDTPGQTAANWDKLNANVSYVPEDQASKVTAFSTPTDTQYPSAKLVKDQLDLKSGTSHTHAADGTKQDLLSSGNNIKTVNGESILGAGNMSITSAASLPGSTEVTATNEGLDSGNATVDTTTVPGQTILKYLTVGATTFTPPTGVASVEYLVVAGGGGGGSAIAGGGGAGGRLGATLGVTAQSYPVTVGAGGAGGTGASANGVSGSNSVFSTLTAIGGGAGAASTAAGIAGGSGGGLRASGSGGAATSGQGFAGGTGIGGTAGSGGGGAGAIGGNAISSAGGAGGAGAASTITGVSVTYAGGGGGGGYVQGANIAGAGGAGGGGAGGVSAAGTAGSANSGGGGGGGGYDNSGPTNHAGGAGGSGVIIIRFATQSRTYQALTSFVDSTAARAGGLLTGDFYRKTSDGSVQQVQ